MKTFQSHVARQRADVDRFRKLADKAQRDMQAACEHYAQAMATLALAHERLERALEATSPSPSPSPSPELGRGPG